MALTLNQTDLTYRTTLGSDEVIIGDKSAPTTFKPVVEFTKWSGENSLIIKPSPELAKELEAQPSLVSDKLEVSGSKIGWYANTDPDNADRFKFGIIWYEKPIENKWSCIIDGWEEFDFWYQPPISIDNPTGARDIDHDGIIEHFVERPEEVVGSYAIYHKIKKNNQYKTGKFCHIYRPRFIDADGKWTWGELEIKNGVFTETCPQDFLDKAVYPVKSNATYGSEAQGASDWDIANGNYPLVFKIEGTMPAAGTITEVHFWIRRWNSDTVTWNVNYYADGSPVGAQRGTTPTAATWAGTSFTDRYIALTGQAEANAAQLWAAYKSNIDCRVTYDSGSGNLAYKGSYNSTMSSMPAGTDFTVALTADRQVACYATYTPSGGGGTVDSYFNRSMLSMGVA
jgi:hypothetical protein